MPMPADDQGDPSAVRCQTYSVADMAKILDLAEMTVRRKHQAGRLPPTVSYSDRLRWSRVMVDRWVAEGCPKVARKGR